LYKLMLVEVIKGVKQRIPLLSGRKNADWPWKNAYVNVQETRPM